MAMSAIRDIYRRVPSANCKGLCADSCGPIPVFSNEPVVALTKTEHKMGLILFDPATTHCPHLKDEKCSVYEDRPLICRLWGSTVRMPCVFGCKPDRWLGEKDATQLLKEAQRSE